jgi:hypothetical protein
MASRTRRTGAATRTADGSPCRRSAMRFLLPMHDLVVARLRRAAPRSPNTADIVVATSGAGQVTVVTGSCS